MMTALHSRSSVWWQRRRKCKTCRHCMLASDDTTQLQRCMLRLRGHPAFLQFIDDALLRFLRPDPGTPAKTATQVPAQMSQQKAW